MIFTHRVKCRIVPVIFPCTRDLKHPAKALDPLATSYLSPAEELVPMAVSSINPDGGLELMQCLMQTCFRIHTGKVQRSLVEARKSAPMG